MSGPRTRSSSVPVPAQRLASGGIVATRSAAKKRIISPAARPNPLVSLANPEQNIIPPAPVLPAIELPTPIEEIIVAAAHADLPEEDPARNLQPNPEILQRMEQDAPDINLPLEPALPLPAGKPLRMYSEEDVKQFIKEAMTEFHQSMRNSEQAPPDETVSHITGSTPSDAIGDDLDIQSVIEVDINEASGYSPTETRRVPVKEYATTTTHQSSKADKINFTNDGNSNRTKLKELNLLLNDCELLTLAEEKRLPAAESESNPYGYTHESAKITGGKIIITKKDDYFKFDADCTRLFAIMDQSTNKDLHYLLTETINS